MKYVDRLRQMQYERLRTTRQFREMQRTAGLPGIDLIALVNFGIRLQRFPKTLRITNKRRGEKCY